MKMAGQAAGRKGTEVGRISLFWREKKILKCAFLFWP